LLEYEKFDTEDLKKILELVEELETKLGFCPVDINLIKEIEEELEARAMEEEYSDEGD